MHCLVISILNTSGLCAVLGSNTYLKEQGRIINISGGSARIAGNLSGGAKCLVGAPCKDLAVQMGKFGITVNCIHPGMTRRRQRQ